MDEKNDQIAHHRIVAGRRNPKGLWPKQQFASHRLIVVSQSEREALAPVRTLKHFAFLIVVLGLLMLTALLAYFWTHREQELADLEVLQIQEPPQGKAASA